MPRRRSRSSSTITVPDSSVSVEARTRSFDSQDDPRSAVRALAASTWPRSPSDRNSPRRASRGRCDRVPLAALHLRVHGVPARDAHARTRQAVAEAAEAVAVVLAVGAAPAHGVADHLGVHAGAVVDDRDLGRDSWPASCCPCRSRSGSRPCRAQPARSCRSVRPAPRRVLVAEVAHAADEGVLKNDADPTALGLLLGDVILLSRDGVEVELGLLHA